MLKLWWHCGWKKFNFMLSALLYYCLISFMPALMSSHMLHQFETFISLPPPAFMRSCSFLACLCICVLLCGNFEKESILFWVNQNDVLLLSLSYFFMWRRTKWIRINERASKRERWRKRKRKKQQRKINRSQERKHEYGFSLNNNSHILVRNMDTIAVPHTHSLPLSISPWVCVHVCFGFVISFHSHTHTIFPSFSIILALPLMSPSSSLFVVVGDK